MRVPIVHCTRILGFLCGAVILCALTGCWEEIHYAGPDPTAKRDASSDGNDSAQRDRYAEPRPQSPDQPIDTMPSGSAATAEPADLLGDLRTPDETTGEAASVEPTPPAGEPAAQPAPPAAEPQRNTRRLAWLLGSKLSLAALANDRGAPAEEVAKWFDQSQSLAQMLGTSAAELPPRLTSSETGGSPDRALDYLFGEGRTLGRSLAERHGDQHAALFELAVKSNVLLALYRPDAPIVGTLAGAIRQAGKRASLPAELWRPLLDEVDRGAPAADVQDAVFSLHANVDRHLSIAAPP
jgi:hypothetical protein